LSDTERSEIQDHPVRLFRGFKQRKYLAGSILIVGSILIAVFAIVETTMTPLSAESASVTNMGPEAAYATFPGIGEYYVNAQCANVNATRSCPLLVSVSFGTPDRVLHDNFYTRSITLKVVNSQGSTLGVEVDTYTTPPTAYRVAYGVDLPSSPFVTITTPSNAPGATWTFTIIVRNPHVLNGKMAIQIVGGTQVVDSRLLGRTYDLHTGVMQLGDYS